MVTAFGITSDKINFMFFHIFKFFLSKCLLPLEFVSNGNKINHSTPLVRWSLYKYKCLWGVGGKGRGSNLQERASHIYTFRLG